jgi:2-aminoethylphosphonate-pyruvate transaminase
MRSLGFETLLPDALQSPIITAFKSPKADGYEFGQFYAALKSRGFVIYPGKVTALDTFRVGNIGNVSPNEMGRLVVAVGESMSW